VQGEIDAEDDRAGLAHGQKPEGARLVDGAWSKRPNPGIAQKMWRFARQGLLIGHRNKVVGIRPRSV
jgi:hypothetical protein